MGAENLLPPCRQDQGAAVEGKLRKTQLPPAAKKLKKIISAGVTLAIGAVVNPTAASTVFVDGEYLLRDCLADNTTARSECIGYIKGVSDALDDTPPDKRNICTPPGVTAGQLRELVVLFLRRNPNRRNYSGSTMVDVALRGAFPCNR
jgi:hypothetical protein